MADQPTDRGVPRPRPPPSSTPTPSRSATRPTQKFVWGEGDDDVALFEEVDREAESRASSPTAKAWRAKRFDAGLGWITGPTEYGGRELPRRLRPRLQLSSRRKLRGARTRASSASASAWWRPRSSPTPPPQVKDAYLPQDVPGRPRRLPALQRARRRLRPRRPADQGRARRRRVGHHRPEGVDLGRPVHRHRRDHLPHRPRPAQAQGPHRLRRRHARARRRGAPAAPDDRRRRRSTRCSSTRCGSPTTTASAT